MRLLTHISRHTFLILGVVFGVALWGFLFLRGESTRKEVTRVESRVTVVEKSPCSGLTARACVTALVASLSDQDLQRLSRKIDRADTSATQRVIRQEVQRQLRARQNQREDRRAPDRRTGGSGAAKPPFRTDPPSGSSPGSSGGVTTPGATPAPRADPTPGSTPSSSPAEPTPPTATAPSGPLPPTTTPTTPAAPPRAPPIVQTPTVTIPSITPVLPTVTIPPVTVPCVPVKPLINC